jgi:hypothetical protein
MKPVKRRTETMTHRGRRIVVTLYPSGFLGLREERTRHEFLLSVGTAFVMAVRAEVDAKRREGGRHAR